MKRVNKPQTPVTPALPLTRAFFHQTEIKQQNQWLVNYGSMAYFLVPMHPEKTPACV